MLQSIVIVLSFCGLLTSCSLWQLKPKKGTLQKQLSVNTLHSRLLEKSSFYLHLIGEMIYKLKRFDSHNIPWQPWQVLPVENPGSPTKVPNPNYHG